MNRWIDGWMDGCIRLHVLPQARLAIVDNALSHNETAKAAAAAAVANADAAVAGKLAAEMREKLATVGCPALPSAGCLFLPQA